MPTKKNNINKNSSKNKTKKNITNNPSFKKLPVGYSLFASKKYKGDALLEYTKQSELKAQDSCLLDNLSWFGNYEVAKSYKKKDTNIYEWKIKKKTNLLNINNENEKYFEKIFKNTKIKLEPTIVLTEKQIKNINYDHPYIHMSPNEKAYYEFCFAFGYITLEEQFHFLKLIKYLILNKYINMVTREGNSIVQKLNVKINYYRLNKLFPKKQKYNRLSFYYFDKYALINLCKIVPKKIISGVYQKNTTSFWFPNFIIYKMNIEEYILFNPHKNLVYDKEISA